MKSNELNSKLIMNLHNDVHAQEKILQVAKIHTGSYYQTFSGIVLPLSLIFRSNQAIQ